MGTILKVNRSAKGGARRSEEHTSELQSHLNLVCRLLLEKKKHTEEVYSHSKGGRPRLRQCHTTSIASDTDMDILSPSTITTDPLDNETPSGAAHDHLLSR